MPHAQSYVLGGRAQIERPLVDGYKGGKFELAIKMPGGYGIREVSLETPQRSRWQFNWIFLDLPKLGDRPSHSKH